MNSLYRKQEMVKHGGHIVNRWYISQRKQGNGETWRSHSEQLVQKTRDGETWWSHSEQLVHMAKETREW